MKPHDPNSNNHPTTRDSAAKKQQDPELEQRCKDHIMSLRLSAEEDLPDGESFNGVDWLKEVEAALPTSSTNSECTKLEHRKLHGRQMYSDESTDICTREICTKSATRTTLSSRN